MLQKYPFIKFHLILIPTSLLYAICFNWCFVPNNIAYGGFTGIAQIINFVFPQLEVGTALIMLNVPIFLFGWKFLSRKFAVVSVYAMLLTSVFIDMVAAIYPFAPMDPLLACIYGGVLLGITIGIIATQEGSTGGTDLAARLVQLRFAWLPVGRLMMALDMVIIIVAAAVFGDINSALYGGVALYISTVVVDMVLYGMDKSLLAYIISDKQTEIGRVIMDDLERGITVLDGHGGYTGDEKKVIMVAFKQREIVKVKRMVRDIDPDAFLILCPAHGIMGFGFHIEDAVGY